MDKRKMKVTVLAVILAVFCAAGCFFVGTGGAYRNEDGTYRHIKAQTSFGHIAAHPAFEQYSQFIIPWRDTMNRIFTPHQSIRSVCAVNHYNTDDIVDGFNWMIDMTQKGQVKFYNYYSQEERTADAAKADTGLIYLSGDQEKPLALVVPGGGLTCVCIFSEGFPVARELHEKGYNVAILKYSADNPAKGVSQAEHMAKQQAASNRDYGAAMQYICKNPEQFQFDGSHYSVWGFSAGGLLSQIWGMDNEYGYEHYGVPKPTVTVLGYSGWIMPENEQYCGSQPPTFFAYTANDKTIGPQLVDSIRHYVEVLRGFDIPVQANEYQEAPHGFGTGAGTDAQGWMEEACAFWEAQTE